MVLDCSKGKNRANPDTVFATRGNETIGREGWQKKKEKGKIFALLGDKPLLCLSDVQGNGEYELLWAA